MTAPLDCRALETRHHELHKTRLAMVDGNLVTNLRTTQRGLSARAYVDGYWGFASAPLAAAAAEAAAGREQVQRQAMANARAMARFGPRQALVLPEAPHRGQHVFAGRPALSATECLERLAQLHAHVRQRYPGLRSARFVIGDEHHAKQLETAAGADTLASIQRAFCSMVLVGEDAGGAPIEVDELLSCKGSLADLDWSLDTVAPLLDQVHEHLQAKRHAVAARGGQHTVVMAPRLAGMLAHEAMGHPCEADAVLGGAVTAGLLGQPVASELITMVDIAHTFDGQEAMIPVYVDDEGSAGRDVVMIDRGRLTGFMHSRETAARLGQAPTGNARAYNPDDEPLVRMRNTVILPGSATLPQMIEGVDDGYLLLRTGNGQADATTEFMFGITLAYEIRGGKVGRAVRGTTLSGSAIQVLKSVDAVGDEMHWDCSGYCGKKQPMVVSMGGPALRARAHLGGE
ncbi:TldD/PmbA family protein [Ideonella sp. A 288]|uniref:TldD/PmbA family protein n=1 Tax=Ideonella sp. A 288 TaxID=1962181 RepID=UPI000B4BDA71|nr:TldD/PmbA family protein [Ideonella sp. A 288]